MSSAIRHHPEPETLLAYAAATLSEPLAAVVATHVSMCSECRNAVSSLEHLGAALFMNAPLTGHINQVVVPMKPVFPDAREHRPRSIAGRLPAPVAAAYDLDLDRVPWKRLGPGVWHHRLALRNRSEGDLRLIRVAAGRAVPEHGHGGTELTLVIEGVFEDATGQYRRGDIQDVDDSIDHQPIVSPDGECICLIATERPARFKSLLGRLSQTWTGL